MPSDTDLVRRCAEAMGLSVVWQLDSWRFPNVQHEQSLYDPLHDDAQAMTLVRKFELAIGRQRDIWLVGYYNSIKESTRNKNLNRAIVECVANMGEK